jgi:hypothetical protein
MLVVRLQCTVENGEAEPESAGAALEEEEEEEDFGKEQLVQKQGAQLARRGITFEAKGGPVRAAALDKHSQAILGDVTDPQLAVMWLCYSALQSLCCVHTSGEEGEGSWEGVARW